MQQRHATLPQSWIQRENWEFETHRWSRRQDPLVGAAIEVLRKKFMTVDHYGPQQLAIFHDSIDDDERAMHARRAFELVQKLLRLL